MGGILAGILAITALIVLGAFLFIKTKKLKNKNANGGVAFENPSYLRETNLEHVHVSVLLNIFSAEVKAFREFLVRTDTNNIEHPTRAEQFVSSSNHAK